MTHPHPAFTAIRDVALETGLPTHFKADVFKHDRRALRHQPHDRPFVWALHDLGSFLVWVDGGLNATTHAFVRSVQEEYPATTWYGWDGVKLARLGQRVIDVVSFSTQFDPPTEGA